MIQLSFDQNSTNSFKISLAASCVVPAIKTLLGKSVMPPPGTHQNCCTRLMLVFPNSHFSGGSTPRKLNFYRTLVQNVTFFKLQYKTVSKCQTSTSNFSSRKRSSVKEERRHRIRYETTVMTYVDNWLQMCQFWCSTAPHKTNTWWLPNLHPPSWYFWL